MERQWVKKTDLLIIAGILLAAGVFYLIYTRLYDTGSDAYAEISVNGRLQTRVSLSQDAVFSIPGHENVEFTVKNGAIAFTRSDCPDKICVKSGYLKHPGQTAACLPNKMSLRIVSDQPDADAPDAVAW